MKPDQSKAIIENVKRRGYVLINGCFYPPHSNEAKLYNLETSHNTGKNKSGLNRLKSALNQKRIKTGWIDDTLNIKNKNNRFDKFITLVHLDLGLEVWPEFYFTIERRYRFDYAIPIHITGAAIRIAVECDGGTHMRGLSGHSSPKGIQRDMDKGTLAAVTGWTLIRRTPADLCTTETIKLIKAAIDTIIGKNSQCV